MSGHIFVDETKHRGYVMVASVVVPADLDPLRKVLRGLFLPGQRRLHMKNESASRKRAIATTIAATGIKATIYDAGRRYRTEREGRSACLVAIVADAGRRNDMMLIIEQDDTLLASDRKVLYNATHEAGCVDLRYEHRRATAEQLLALPDAIAWCWVKGGDWRRRIQPVVTHIRNV